MPFHLMTKEQQIKALYKYLLSAVEENRSQTEQNTPELRRHVMKKVKKIRELHGGQSQALECTPFPRCFCSCLGQMGFGQWSPVG